MFDRSVARIAVQAWNATCPAALKVALRPAASSFVRPLSYTAIRANKKNQPKRDTLLAATAKISEDSPSVYEGGFARTDENVQIEYPSDSEMPAQPILQGRGGMHFKRTLAQFSLEDKVSVVTGGARGLGLVMAQGLVVSGSDLAIVDLNSACLEAHTCAMSEALF